MVDEINGRVYRSKSKYGDFIYAKLGIAAENSGKLVTLVREIGYDTAFEKGKDLILADGPPGIGCPLIASLTGANLALVVTEPTGGNRGRDDPAEVVLRRTLLPADPPLLVVVGLHTTRFSLQVRIEAQVDRLALRRFPQDVQADVRSSENLRTVIRVP